MEISARKILSPFESDVCSAFKHSSCILAILKLAVLLNLLFLANNYFLKENKATSL